MTMPYEETDAMLSMEPRGNEEDRMPANSQQTRSHGVSHRRWDDARVQAVRVASGVSMHRALRTGI
jgi:hypothetical protein